MWELFKRKPKWCAERSVVFTTKKAKYQGLLEDIRQAREQAAVIMAAAHDRNALDTCEQMLDLAGIETRRIKLRTELRTILASLRSGSEKGVLITCSDVFTDMEPTREDAAALHDIRFFVSEHGMLRDRDEVVVKAATAMGSRYEVSFYCSLEDELMKSFVNESVKKQLIVLGLDENERIEHAWMHQSIINAQKQVKQSQKQRKR